MNASNIAVPYGTAEVINRLTFSGVNSAAAWAAAVRTKQIMRGARPLVNPGENKSVVTALREVAAGLVGVTRSDQVSDASLQATLQRLRRLALRHTDHRRLLRQLWGR